MSPIGALLGTILLLAMLVLLARVVLDWVGVLAPSAGPGLSRARAIVYRITEPVIAPVRRVVPPLRIGGLSIDLAFTIVFIGVLVLRAIVVRF
ncbi:YggT family protein [Petropleomorpha daqingensis]|uniref:YggT family protein n=1 Tax=Petropleomorpha daqingensis TaxID=2026353 RepID=A0A853CQW3_9ACTN|nr:YggT family protein [Petropleomorpha daqingensis]NYJ08313.1 YggT family protein [Petropleomorpha daqingensis]